VWAIMYDHLDIADMLIDRGADMEAQDNVSFKRMGE